MKQLWAFSLFLFSVLSAYSQPTINWIFHLQKTNDSVYSMQATADVEKGWYGYGENTAVEGLTPPQFSFDYENVHPSGQADF